MTDVKNQSSVRVVVLGAGYGGLLAAIRLVGKSRRAAVTLVNQSDVFVERPTLHQYAASQRVRRRKLVDMLDGTRIRFVHGRVDHINLASRTVSVAETADTASTAGRTDVAYDYLVYALGSLTDLDGVPGVRDYAFSLEAAGTRTVEDLKTLLPTLNKHSAHLVVVGGGPTGVEAAAEFAESYPNLRVTLATHSQVLPQFPGKPRDHVLEALARLNVDVKTDTRITAATTDAVVAEDGSEIPFDACLWTGGFKAPTLAARAGLAVNERAQVLIDPYMRSISHPDVFALGDAAYPGYAAPIEVRMGAYTASVMGGHTADCLASVLNGQAPKPLSFTYAGQGIALGRKDVVGFSIYPAGAPTGPLFTGSLGARIRGFFVHFLGNLPIIEKRVPGFFYWTGKGRIKTWSQPSAGVAMLTEDRAA